MKARFFCFFVSLCLCGDHPPDRITKIISAGACVLLLLMGVLTHNTIVGCVSVLVVLLSYAWSPRGYALREQSIVVKRPIGGAPGHRAGSRGACGTVRVPYQRVFRRNVDRSHHWSRLACGRGFRLDVLARSSK